jgi:hypothetical protein
VGQEVDDGNYRWTDDDHTHTRKDEKHKRGHELNGCLCGSFLGFLPSVDAKGIGELTERLCNRCSEAVRLNQHGHKRPRAFEIGPLREGLPRRISLYPSPLFKFDKQELFTQFAMTYTQFSTDTRRFDGRR